MNFRFRPVLQSLEFRDNPSGIEPGDGFLPPPPPGGDPGDPGQVGDPSDPGEIGGPIDQTGGGGIELIFP